MSVDMTINDRTEYTNEALDIDTVFDSEYGHEDLKAFLKEELKRLLNAGVEGDKKNKPKGFALIGDCKKDMATFLNIFREQFSGRTDIMSGVDLRKGESPAELEKEVKKNMEEAERRGEGDVKGLYIQELELFPPENLIHVVAHYGAKDLYFITYAKSEDANVKNLLDHSVIDKVYYVKEPKDS